MPERGGYENAAYTLYILTVYAVVKIRESTHAVLRSDGFGGNETRRFETTRFGAREDRQESSNRQEMASFSRSFSRGARYCETQLSSFPFTLSLASVFFTRSLRFTFVICSLYKHTNDKIHVGTVQFCISLLLVDCGFFNYGNCK